MIIFQQIDPPPKQARLRINQEASWYTWSRDFRCLFKSWKRQVDALKSPTSIHLLGGREYDDTYSLDLTLISDKGLLRDLTTFARDLYGLEISTQLMLFHELIDESLSRQGLRFLFAFLRAAIVSCSRDPLSALCQPISRSQKRGNEFPLHSDLYIPAILFNVFDDVTHDSSGASLFLSVSSVIKLLGKVKFLPAETRHQITENLTRMHDKDRYEENYDLLHGCHDWTKDIEKRMERQLLKVKLFSGQGYMIHDRKWLHGREALSGSLSSKRLHRLVFNTRQIQASVSRRRVSKKPAPYRRSTGQSRS